MRARVNFATPEFFIKGKLLTPTTSHQRSILRFIRRLFLTWSAHFYANRFYYLNEYIIFIYYIYEIINMNDLNIYFLNKFYNITCFYSINI